MGGRSSSSGSGRTEALPGGSEIETAMAAVDPVFAYLAFKAFEMLYGELWKKRFNDINDFLNQRATKQAAGGSGSSGGGDRSPSVQPLAGSEEVAAAAAAAGPAEARSSGSSGGGGPASPAAMRVAEAQEGVRLAEENRQLAGEQAAAMMWRAQAEKAAAIATLHEARAAALQEKQQKDRAERQAGQGSGARSHCGWAQSGG